LKDDKEALYAHHYKTEKEYKTEFEFLKEAAGFPKFKAKKKHKDSYRTGMSIAVDVDNLGNSPNYVRVYRKGETRLAKYQRRLARKPSGSRNREKSK
jgi:transposase